MQIKDNNYKKLKELQEEEIKGLISELLNKDLVSISELKDLLNGYYNNFSKLRTALINIKNSDHNEDL